MRSLTAIFKIFLLACWSIPMVLVQLLVRPFTTGRGAYTVPHFWHKGICRILGLKVEICGTPVHNAQLIYISNHLSYLDIPVIGSVLKASFIAKEDIANWPVIGYLATLQQTAFISRASNKAKKVANALDDMLRQGKSLILFPEGTSTPGLTVIPFKSSLFALALPKESSPIPIQPFIIELIEVNGATPTLTTRDYYSWYGDMEFAPHIWVYLKNKGATARLTFKDVITPTTADDRKTLCQQVETAIRAGLAASSAPTGRAS